MQRNALKFFTQRSGVKIDGRGRMSLIETRGVYFYGRRNFWKRNKSTIVIALVIAGIVALFVLDGIRTTKQVHAAVAWADQEGERLDKIGDIQN